MALTLDDDERHALLDESMTGVLTTLRRDGRPIALPIWYVRLEEDLYTRTPSTTAKLRRIRHDARGSFLVERGERWLELTALHVDVEITEVTDEALRERALAALDAKYAAYGPPQERLPTRVQEYYADRVVLRLHPVGEALSWANAKLRLRS